MPGLIRLLISPSPPLRGVLPLLGLGLGLALLGCQPQREQAETAPSPPVGHYEGSIGGAGEPELRAALDIRHPSPGHYEAELTVPTAGTLSFVSDSVFFSNNHLRLTRPGRPDQVLTLTLEGDFWRGVLALDSAKSQTILVKRGTVTPSTYRVEEVPQDSGSAWLFAPSDTETPGPALALLPDAATAPAAALWADALAREGIIVLMLPPADSANVADEAQNLQAALRLLRDTPGTDTTDVGLWVAGARAGSVAKVLAGANGPRIAFGIVQNAEFDLAGRAAFRELKKHKLPLLGLYSGPTAAQRAAVLRNALGGRHGTAVRTYRTLGPNLLVPGGMPRFGPGLPEEVIQWLRER